MLLNFTPQKAYQIADNFLSLLEGYLMSEMQSQSVDTHAEKSWVFLQDALWCLMQKKWAILNGSGVHDIFHHFKNKLVMNFAPTSAPSRLSLSSTEDIIHAHCNMFCFKFMIHI